MGAPLDRSTTVRIAGAGLSGLVAACLIGEGGRDVEVYETKTSVAPSSGPHTEGIRNYRERDSLDELASVGFRLPPFATTTRTVRCSRSRRTILTGPAHHFFLRGRDPETVDQVLYARALAAGVRFHFGEPLPEGGADVVATGPPRDRTEILGAGRAFSVDGSHLSPDVIYAYFDNDVAPAGYLTIAPGKRFHSIYSVSWKEFDYDRLLARTEAAFELPWIREILGTSRWVGRIHGRAHYLEDPVATAERGGALYVGEAGGFQDAVAGFGFRYAVITGGLAARALVQGLDYRELLRDAFGSEFRDAFTFRRRFLRATNDDYDAMLAALGPEVSLEEYVRRRDPRGF